MKIYGVQLDIQWENKAANFARVQELVEHAALAPGSMVALPEMFGTGFSMDASRIAETEQEATGRFMSSLAKTHSILVLGGIVSLHEDGRGKNELAVYDPQGLPIARYCKMHPFSYSGENNHYAAGENITLFDWQGFRVAPFICYDLRFPEIFRAAVKQGANLFVVIANWPAQREAHWKALLTARAIENQAYVLGVNRCGDDPKLHYSGQSRLINPRGEVVAEIGENEGIFGGELDWNDLQEYRNEFPALADMRF